MGQDHVYEAHLLELCTALGTQGLQQTHVQLEGDLAVSIQTSLAAVVHSQPGQCHHPCPPATMNVPAARGGPQRHLSPMFSEV